MDFRNMRGKNMNWKKYYENIVQDENSKKLLYRENEKRYDLCLPQQIVQLWKSQFCIKTEEEEEALTKFLAYGRIFIVKDNVGKNLIVDEFSQNVRYKCEDGVLFFLEYVVTNKRRNGKTIIDQKEKHQIIKTDGRVEHFILNLETNTESVEILEKMPKMFYLSLMGKKGVPCYYNGVQLIGEISQGYQELMMKFNQKEYVYLQVLQDVLKESQLLNIQLIALGHLLGITDVVSVLNSGMMHKNRIVNDKERIIAKGNEILGYLQ